MGKILSPRKKLDAGDAQWAHLKELLGFVFDGQARTVHLTQRKASGIAEATAKLLKKNHSPRAQIPISGGQGEARHHHPACRT